MYRNILVFDVETTGLIPKKDPITKEHCPIEKMPYVIQLSFVIYSMVEHRIIRYYNAYIRLENMDLITPEITQLTGISRSICEERGINIHDALMELWTAYKNHADIVVSHNLFFDKCMVRTEIKRNIETLEPIASGIRSMFYEEDGNANGKPELLCTMMSSIHICNLWRESPNGKMFKKFPKLIELYYELFHETPENLHNSLVDSVATLRCFLKIKMKHDMHTAKYRHIVKTAMKLV
jgi:DNA polymerase III epsilon subunit-like protein